MIKFDKKHKIFYVKCDACGNELEFETESCCEGIDEIIQDSWTLKKISGKNYSFCCSECKEYFLEMLKLSEDYI